MSIRDLEHFTAIDGEEFSLHPDEVLGAGAQGTVYKGKRLRDGKAVAIKVIPTWRLILDERGEEKLVAIEEEVGMLRKIGQHPGIAGMLGEVDFHRPDNPSQFPHFKCIVMEAVDGSELAEHVALEGAMKESLARHVFLQILEALGHVHSQHVIHRDLKPENVLVTGDTITLDSKVKLIDFGVAKCLKSGPMKTIVGTPLVMAPEVAAAKISYAGGGSSSSSSPATEKELAPMGGGGGAAPASWSPPAAANRHSFSWGAPAATEGAGGGAAGAAKKAPVGTVTMAKPREFCPKIDVWSAGVVLYTCLVGRMPFTSELDIIETDYCSKALGHISEEAKAILAGMLEKDPDRRLSIEECLTHPWVSCSEEDGCTIILDDIDLNDY